MNPHSFAGLLVSVNRVGRKERGDWIFAVLRKARSRFPILENQDCSQPMTPRILEGGVYDNRSLVHAHHCERARHQFGSYAAWVRGRGDPWCNPDYCRTDPQRYRGASRDSDTTEEEASPASTHGNADPRTARQVD